MREFANNVDQTFGSASRVALNRSTRALRRILNKSHAAISGERNRDVASSTTACVGAQGRNRTTDTVIFSHVLYQLSYLGAGTRRRAGRGNDGGL
jgi:hypothetical protein